MFFWGLVAQTFFPKANIKAHASSDVAVQEILENRAHAYVASVPEINFLSLTNGNAVDVPLSEPIMASREGLAVRKGEQQLLNFLNAWVTSHKADRWLDATRDYWFESLDWAEDIKE